VGGSAMSQFVPERVLQPLQAGLIFLPIDTVPSSTTAAAPSPYQHLNGSPYQHLNGSSTPGAATGEGGTLCNTLHVQADRETAMPVISPPVLPAAVPRVAASSRATVNARTSHAPQHTAVKIKCEAATGAGKGAAGAAGAVGAVGPAGPAGATAGPTPALVNAYYAERPPRKMLAVSYYARKQKMKEGGKS
jgi:hypothetical protein